MFGAILGAAIGAVGSYSSGKSQNKAARRASKQAAEIAVQDREQIARENAADREQIARENELARKEHVQDVQSAHNDAVRAVAAAAAADAENIRRRNADVNELKGLLQTDQERASAAARADEARLAGLRGVDFQKLVADAQAAGFNPLTALAAAGTSAYERASSFISTPFIGFAQAFSGTPQLAGIPVEQSLPAGYARQSLAGVGQSLAGVGSADRVQAARDRIGTAGYVGSAVSNFGQNLIGISQEHSRLMQDAELARAAAAERRDMFNEEMSIYGRSSVPGVGRVNVSDARPRSQAGGTAQTGYVGAILSEPVRENVAPSDNLFGVTRVFGEDYVGANPDMDNELLNAGMLATLPVQMAIRYGYRRTSPGPVYNDLGLPGWTP